MSWENEARRILKIELVRYSFTYKRLALHLENMGVKETERSVGNKMQRGTFSFLFFLQCMKAMGARSITIDLDDVEAVPKRKV